MAIDPSLTSTGWALFSIETDQLLAVGTLRTKSTRFSLASRLLDLQKRVGEVLDEIQLGRDDVLVCEAPTTMRDPKAALKVEQVRGMFEVLGRERGANVPGRLNPRTVQRELIGLRGKQLPRPAIKAMAAEIAARLYSSDLLRLGLPCEPVKLQRHQDIVDAILVGNLGVARITAARQGGLALEDLFYGQDQRLRRRLPR